jgi:hypothetical protein
VNISAPVAHVTRGRGVGPVEIEEGGDGGVQLGFALPEMVVSADLAAEWLVVDPDGFRMLFPKESHVQSLNRLAPSIGLSSLKDETTALANDGSITCGAILPPL